MKQCGRNINNNLNLLMSKFHLKQFLALSFSLLLLQNIESAPAFAAANPPSETESPALTRDEIIEQKLNAFSKKHEVQIGEETFYSLFRKSGKVATQGFMHGFNGRYTYRPGINDLLHFKFLDMYRLEGLYSFGKVDYSAPLAGADYNIKDYMYETRALLGKDIAMFQQAFITPYLGFGYRHLSEDTSGRLTTSGIYGYLRQNSYWYIPIGIDLAIPVTNQWLAIFNAEYDHWISGLLKSRFNDSEYFYPGTNNDNLNNRQHRGLGIRGSVKLIRQGSLVNFYMEPFIRYWHVKNSNEEFGNLDGFYDFNIERKNKTTEAGVKLGVQF